MRRRFETGKRLYVVYSHSKNVSAVRNPYLPPETTLSRTYSVPALTRVGHHFPCSAQPHRASSRASPSPSPDYVVRRHSTVCCVALFSRCHDAVPTYRIQLTQVCLLLAVAESWCARVVRHIVTRVVRSGVRASVSCIVAIWIVTSVSFTVVTVILTSVRCIVVTVILTSVRCIVVTVILTSVR
jgi:hypothetical protein